MDGKGNGRIIKRYTSIIEDQEEDEEEDESTPLSPDTERNRDRCVGKSSNRQEPTWDRNHRNPSKNPSGPHSNVNGLDPSDLSPR